MAIIETVSSLFLSVLSAINVSNTLAAIVIFTFYWYRSAPSNLPPGPPRFPIVGYLPILGKQAHITFDNLAKKYGPIFSLYFGNELVIVLNNYEAIKTAFVKHADIFAGRPHTHLTMADPDQYSMTFSDGNHWITHRRFALNILRNLGVGKMSIEPLITEEIQRLLNELKKFNGEPNDFSELLISSVSNTICILIFGKRFEYNDPWFISAKRTVNLYVRHASPIGLFHFFPWLKKLPGIAALVNQRTLLKLMEDFKKSMEIEIIKRNSHTDDQKECYITAFLREQKARAMKDSNDDTFQDAAFEQNVRALLMAGSETTAYTFMWGILCLIVNPEVQSKVQKEIDDVIGTDRTPCYNDRLRTPYTEATICEINRFSTLAPTSLTHRNTEECEILGYTIPKSSMIISNLWAVHNDVKLWGDPQVFRPERFLTPDGKFDKKEYMIAFSIGKRECLGIELAKMELYLYFTSMLQHFTFKSSDGATPSLEAVHGLNSVPKYFCVRAASRTVDKHE